MGKPRPMREPKGIGFTVGVLLLKPLLWTFTRHRWIDGTKLPETGGAVIVANHISHVDPVTFAHFMWDHGRLPRYLAKDAMFRLRVLGWLLRDMGQIPVHRESKDASQAFGSAVKAVREGKAVIVYPEGTLTRDPGLWPMVGRTGAARIALETGCPVIPVGQWGAQDLLYPYAKRPHLLPRTHITMKAGDPVPLDDLRERPRSAETINAASAQIMEALTELVADIRGEEPPAERFDPRKAGVRMTGDPHKKDR